MARKLAHLQARGKLTPRERIWAAIREQKRFTIYLLARRVHIDDRTVESYVIALARAGYLVIFKKAEGVIVRDHASAHLVQFELRNDVGIDAPRVNREGREITLGNGTLAMWRAMKAHRKEQYTADQLAGFATIETLRIAPNTAQAYCQMLARAGYLQVTRPSKPGTPACYRLVKWTGPKAPQIQRVKHLYDPNLGEVVWHPYQSAVNA